MHPQQAENHPNTNRQKPTWKSSKKTNNIIFCLGRGGDGETLDAGLRKAGIRTKSGVMLGLGETVQEVRETMEDLRSVDCQVLTLGQYLQPTPKHLPVAEFVHPDTFDMLREEGLAMGFLFVESGPLVRSSYHAEKHVV